MYIKVLIAFMLEQHMRWLFESAARKAYFHEIKQKIDKPIVGMELELGVYDENGKPQKRININHPKISPELGNHQMELITDPMRINSINQFRNDYKNDLSETISWIKQKLSGHGTIPNLSLEDFEVSPNITKYEVVPKYHNDRVDVGFKENFKEFDARHIGLCNSLQINMDCESGKDAINKLNKSFEITPYLVALFGNAKILNNKDTGFKDCRIDLWKETHDTRNVQARLNEQEPRMGEIFKYFDSVEDYMYRVMKNPFIMHDGTHTQEDAFGIGIGMNWKDARMKYIKKGELYQPVVEFRPISSQASTEEDLAVIMTYIGLVHDTKKLNYIGIVNHNRESALVDGLEGVMFDDRGNKVPTLKLVNQKMNVAKNNLIDMGYDRNEVNKVFEPIDRILDERKSPADRYSVNQIDELVKNSFRN